jgi:hypothetical protein
MTSGTDFSASDSFFQNHMTVIEFEIAVARFVGQSCGGSGQTAPELPQFRFTVASDSNGPGVRLLQQPEIANGSRDPAI